MKKAKGLRVNQTSAPVNIFINVFFFIMCALIIIPFTTILAVSLTDNTYLSIEGYRLLPIPFSTQAYEMLLEDPTQIINSYLVSIFVTVVGTVVGVMMTAMVSYALSRPRFGLRRPISFFIFFSMLFNGGLVPTYILYSQYLHLKDTIWILIIPMLLNSFNVIVMRSYFTNNVPESIIESAKMDGAGDFKIFLRIVMPLASPIVAIISFNTAIAYWNDWYLGLIYITKYRLTGIQYLLIRIQTNLEAIVKNANLVPVGDQMILKYPEYSMRMAMVIIAILPLVILYPLVSKFFVQGLTIGAVKG